MIIHAYLGNPIFSIPHCLWNFSGVAVRNLQRNTSSLVTLLAVGGMLDQTGKKCIRVSGDYEDPQIQEKVDNFVKGVYVAEGIRRSSYGMIGGRSIGIGTTVADPSQWQSTFGVEFDPLRPV